ncbi:MAG: septum formation initiator family protein [Nitrospiria bacterium]
MSRKEQKKNIEISRKPAVIFIALSVLANGYLLFTFIFGEMGFINALQLKETHRQIKAEVRSLKQKNQQISLQIDALNHDPKAIERLARERLGLVKKGELVYEFFQTERP